MGVNEMMSIRERASQGRPLIMGILNVTPDSFSDGGRYGTIDAAVSRALVMVEEGADIIDVGGESTRPGSRRVSAEEQVERVIPVIQALCDRLPSSCLISIDTTLADVAEAAVRAGAGLINDVSAGMDDPRILSVAAELAVPIVLMHRQGTPESMQDDPRYSDVVGEVRALLLDRIEAALSAGLSPDAIVLDPGIGFGKRKEHNLNLMAALDVFVALGYPVLLGASRKRFMGAICQEQRPEALLGATVATTALGVMAGVQIFRVHDVQPNRQAADVTAAIRRSA